MMDLGISLGLNYGASMKAASTPTLRWSWSETNDSIFTDYRFGLGLIGVAAQQYGSGDIKRGGEVLANSQLHSLAAGEAYRNESIKRARAHQQAAAQRQPPGALPGGQQMPGGQFQGAYDYDYAGY
jgi:hypothetical protein